MRIQLVARSHLSIDMHLMIDEGLLTLPIYFFCRSKTMLMMTLFACGMTCMIFLPSFAEGRKKSTDFDSSAPVSSDRRPYFTLLASLRFACHLRSVVVGGPFLRRSSVRPSVHSIWSSSFAVVFFFLFWFSGRRRRRMDRRPVPHPL